MEKRRGPGETNVSISLPKSLLAQARQYAKARDITLSQFIRALIREHLGIKPEVAQPGNVITYDEIQPKAGSVADAAITPGTPLPNAQPATCKPKRKRKAKS